MTTVFIIKVLSVKGNVDDHIRDFDGTISTWNNRLDVIKFIETKKDNQYLYIIEIAYNPD